eukprot:s2178_g17.t1
MSKGGARHFAKPAIDPGILLRIFKDHSALISNLGIYETVSKSGAVSPKGLLDCKALLQDIIEVAPTCELAPQVLRTSLMNLLAHDVSLNSTKWNGATWCNIKAERVTVLLSHLRKVAREKDQQRLCTAKLTSHQYQQLETIFSEVVIKDEDPLEKGKCLKRKTSDASLDSDGFPKILQSPEVKKSPCKKGSRGPPKDEKAKPHTLWRRAGSSCTKTSKPLEKRQQEEAGSTATEQSLQDKMGYGSKPKKKPASKTKAKPKATPTKCKKPLQQGKPKTKADDKKKFCQLRVTNAKKPERSYLTGCHLGTTQRRLVVEVPAKWTKKYKTVVQEIKEKMEAKGLTKAEALALRTKLVAAQTRAAASSSATSTAAKKEDGPATSPGEAEPDPEEPWEEKKSKRKKKQDKKKAAEHQQKKQPTYLEVAKGDPLQKGRQEKKRGKVDDNHYVSLGTDSSSSSVAAAQPPTPPKPSRLSGTPAQAEKLGLPERPQRPPKRQPLQKRLALDWHNCFQIREQGRDVVPNRHIRAFWDLQSEGWEIFLLSFAGQRRGDEVLAWAKSLPIKWAGMKVACARCGPWGKAAWALHHQCTHVLDDCPEILQESLEKGLEVLPISTYWERHQWASNQGIPVYRDFVAAVADLVDL